MKTMIAVPCMDQVQTEFCKSLCNLKHIGSVKHSFTSCSLIYQARTDLGQIAIQEKSDFVLWLDSDMVFRPDLLIRLSKDMDEGREMVSAVYFKRKPPFTPICYKTLEYSEHDNKPAYKLEPYLDYPKDDVFQAAGCGFGAVMMTTDLIRKVAERFGYPFSPMMGIGEDLSFCWRVNQLGVPIWCDSRIKVGHSGVMTVTEETYLTSRQEAPA
jgi:GT2 family glycosyltransferase